MNLSQDPVCRERETFVVSGTQLARIHPPEPAGDTSRSRGIAGGVRWIRSGWDEREPAIILISSHAEEAVEELVTESPAAGFLAKSSLSASAIQALICDNIG
jgi:hypothetical protein